jgi:hypothetical protein
MIPFSVPDKITAVFTKNLTDLLFIFRHYATTA